MRALILIISLIGLPLFASEKPATKEEKRKPAAAGQFYCDGEGFALAESKMNTFCNPAKPFSVNPNGNFCCIAK